MSSSEQKGKATLQSHSRFAGKELSFFQVAKVKQFINFFLCLMVFWAGSAQAAALVAPVTGNIEAYAANEASLAGYSGDGGLAVNAQLAAPRGIAVDSLNRVYIADYNNSVVRRVDPATGLISTVAGTGVFGFSGDGGLATTAQLKRPWGLAVDALDNLYIADYADHRIRKIDVVTGVITTIAGTGAYAGIWSRKDGGDATLAAFTGITGITVDAAGNIFVATDLGRIRRIDGVTNIITSIATGYGFISDVAMDPFGGVPGLYFSDRTNHVVNVLDLTSLAVTTVAGFQGIAGYTGDGGIALDAGLNAPESLVMNAVTGELFIADSGNHVVRRIDIASGYISTDAGTPGLGAGNTGDGGTALASKMHTPSGLAMDGNGSILFSDFQYNRVRIYQPVPVFLNAIETSFVSSTMSVDSKQQLEARGVYSDGSRRVLASVVWSSSSNAIATVDASGVVTAVSPGNVTFTAVSGAASATVQLTITAATITSLELSPLSSLPSGISHRYAIWGLVSDGSKVNVTAYAALNSSNTALITTGTYGLITAVAAGTATISATYGALSVSSSVTVSAATLNQIEVVSQDRAIATKTSTRFFATGIYSDGSRQDLSSQVTWSSSNSLVAPISNSHRNIGVTSGLTAGNVSITATLGALSGSAPLEVRVADLLSIEVSPYDISVSTGEFQGMRVTGRLSDNTKQDLTYKVVWSSSNEAIAKVGNVWPNFAKVEGVSPGVAMITATFGGLSASVAVTVNNSTLSRIEVSPFNNDIMQGTNMRFYATAIYSDGRKVDVTYQTAWSSSASGIVNIRNDASNMALADGVSAGLATITGNYVDAQGVLHTDSVDMNVTAGVYNGFELSTDFIKNNVGHHYSLRALAFYNTDRKQDITNQISWKSSNPSAVRVSPSGRVTGVVTGSATVSGTFNGTTLSVPVTVLPAVVPAYLTITPSTKDIPLGQQYRLRAVVTYTDGSEKDVSLDTLWLSTQPTVAPIGNNWPGIATVTALSTGNTTIGGFYKGLHDSVSVFVNTSTLTAVNVTAPQASLPASLGQRYTATAVYSDGSQYDVSSKAVWSSDNLAAARIGNGGISNAKMASFSPGGVVNISASFGGMITPSTFTANNVALVDIEITPTTLSMPLKMDQYYRATGVYSDGSRVTLSNQDVVWRSSDQLNAPIGNAAWLNNARVYGMSPTLASISAHYKGVQSSVPSSLTVTGATLVDIQITPLAATILTTGEQLYTAYGTYSDGTTQNLTYKVIWLSDNHAAATIGSTWPLVGKARGVGVGIANITATYHDKLDTTVGTSLIPAVLTVN